MVFPQSDEACLAGSRVDFCRGRMGQRWGDRAIRAPAAGSVTFEQGRR